MEQFKDIERENKTKPHSKQGLIAEEKLDPKVKEKSDSIEILQVCCIALHEYFNFDHWIEYIFFVRFQGFLNRLSEQGDVYECEIEKIAPSNGGRKSKKIDRDVSDSWWTFLVWYSPLDKSLQKQRRVDEFKHRLEKHKFHTQKLELIMRLVNNDTIDSQQVWQLSEAFMNTIFSLLFTIF